MKNAFTMIELVFAIVVIGILAVVAVPKLAPIIGDAQDAKVRATIASVRSAISTERQKRILRGDFATPMTDLKYNRTSAWNKPIFDYFDHNKSLPILEYPLRSCKSTTARRNCWYSKNKRKYVYYRSDGSSVPFYLSSKGFKCNPNHETTGRACRDLTE